MRDATVKKTPKPAHTYIVGGIDGFYDICIVVMYFAYDIIIRKMFCTMPI